MQRGRRDSPDALRPRPRATYERSPPFALSLSKGCPSFLTWSEGQGFDKLSPNGTVQFTGLPPSLRQVAVLDMVAELGDPAVEPHLDLAGGAVALLGDD